MHRHLTNATLLAVVLLTAFSCNDGDHFISDARQRSEVDNDFKAKKKELLLDDIFAFCDSDTLSKKEREAMHFMYAYMPLCDITDYPPEYHLRNIRMSFRAKEETSWGAYIPEREFNHFVLPARVNNESLDDFRATYYEELRDRVAGKSPYNAILEINHWCHEHVNYRGSDSRTSSPMATMKTSWGRCGEESTLLVAALRTVCIPARQVYTPRWAHCDDNHAWVEAYFDGVWYYLGACEPEPILNLGWFSVPAARTMLVHTRVFGDYKGPEEVISRNKNFTEINVVRNYGGSTKTLFTVTDENGKPLPHVTVEFKIYNYAEFCTVAQKDTDRKGQTWLRTGLGTMMAYASHNGKFGFTVFNANVDNNVTIVINQRKGDEYCFDSDIIPPEPVYAEPEISDELRQHNEMRLSHEDSLRNSYVESCKKEQGLLADSANDLALKEIYSNSWGNYKTIADFVDYARQEGDESRAVQLLSAITAKDLRDVTFEVLKDHLDHTPSLTSSSLRMEPELYAKYILSPRINAEALTAFRGKLSTLFDDAQAEQFRNDPTLLAEWVKSNIEIRNDLNPQAIAISPEGVLKAHKADTRSRDICYVAIARSLCIPAQINPVTGSVQYFDDKWIDVDFGEKATSDTAIGHLIISYTATASLPDPKYYTHFSIKKFDGAHFNLLAYDAQDPGIDDGLNLSRLPKPLELEAGYYILTTGTRLDDGSVMAHSQLFNIGTGDTTRIELVMRQPDTHLNIIGTFDTKTLADDISTSQKCSVGQPTGYGYFILGLIDHGSEPTKHAISDIAIAANEIKKLGTPIILVFNNKDSHYKYMGEFGYYIDGNLPNLTKKIDNGSISRQLAENLHLDTKNLPIFIIANAKGEVVFLKQGYTIGLGEQMMKVLAES